MIKTILVPIDFSVASLNTLKLALESCNDQEVNVVLMYSQYLDDSITELLFYSSEKTIKQLISDDFNEALEMIKNRFESILAGEITIKLFHGKTLNAFNNFADANKIDAIYIPKNYILKTSNRSFSPVSFIRKSKFSIIEIDWEIPHLQNEKEQLILLAFSPGCYTR